MQVSGSSPLDRAFLAEYTSQDAIRKYSSQTAGHGVNYLIEHDYARVYDRALEVCGWTSRAPLRLLEFGCGAGMNLIGLVSRLERRGMAVKEAFGTDFSPTLIAEARREAREQLSPALQRTVQFHVARNEHLSRELASATNDSPQQLFGTFDLVFGVNTFRYCHRLRSADRCADDIFRLLRPGGVSVMIDMNNRFPLFRSRWRRSDDSAEECYLPTLDEYAAPFERTGFEMLTRDRFCWIPHSAGPRLTTICRTLTPVLDRTVRSLAMRTLVIARRPL